RFARFVVCLALEECRQSRARVGRAPARSAARTGGIPMIRHVAAIAVALCLNASWLCAQSTVFTVNTASADVHKSPSTGGPVIGQAPRGTVLEVTRELGSWIKVVWPEGQDGVGYVHVSMGLIAHGFTPVPSLAGLTSAQPAVGSASPPATAARLELTDPVSDTRLGFQTFGGGEVTFASAPRFALSADLGYHWRPTSFAGFELGGLGLSVSGHWYVK